MNEYAQIGIDTTFNLYVASGACLSKGRYVFSISPSVFLGWMISRKSAKPSKYLFNVIMCFMGGIKNCLCVSKRCPTKGY